MDNPSTIFKYEPLSLRAIQNLKASSVYFGSPANFNDPYDCSLNTSLAQCPDAELEQLQKDCVNCDSYPPEVRVEIPNLTPRQFEDKVRRGAETFLEDAVGKFLNTNGVTCFSESNDNLLMWSHYASQHKGFVLEFNTDFEPFNKLQQVKYVDEMPQFKLQDFVRNENHSKLLELFCTKSSDWAYEKEWRALYGSAGTQFTYEREALKAIYFGPKISSQDMDLLCFVCHSEFPETEMWTGAQSQTEFSVEFRKTPGYTPYLEARAKALA